MAPTELITRPHPLLMPFAVPFGWIVRTRNILYDRGILRSVSAKLPVVSVGNVIAGGSGKTPFARLLASELAGRGHRPVILSRGYGGTAAGPLEVGSQSELRAVGDEALMQAKALAGIAAVVVARVRADGARYIAERNLGNLIILDDGFQHRALKRDVDLLLCDVSSAESTGRWASGSMLPAGWLREPFVPALRRATAVVLVTRDGALAPPETPALPCPTFHLRLSSGALRDARSGIVVESPMLMKRRCVVVTAIAGPESFLASVRASGINPAEKHVFRDHAQFSAADAASWWIRPETTVICTEKDRDKLLAVAPADGSVVVLELRATLSERDSFFEFLEARLHHTVAALRA